VQYNYKYTAYYLSKQLSQKLGFIHVHFRICVFTAQHYDSMVYAIDL